MSIALFILMAPYLYLLVKGVRAQAQRTAYYQDKSITFNPEWRRDEVLGGTAFWAIVVLIAIMARSLTEFAIGVVLFITMVFAVIYSERRKLSR